jgi:hypothetical protein
MKYSGTSFPAMDRMSFAGLAAHGHPNLHVRKTKICQTEFTPK